jgi:adenosylmethionine-8-amino-7-oxononanoate aminotransferase
MKMNETTICATPLSNSLWAEFADAAAAATVPARDAANIGAALTPALVNLTMGRAAAAIAQLAERYKGRPILYVGSDNEAIPLALREAGHSLTVHSPYRQQPHEIAQAGAAPYGLIVMPSFTYGAWNERAGGNGFVEKLIAALADDGALVIDQQDWDEINCRAQTMHATALEIDGATLAAHIGWDASSEAQCLNVITSYQDDANPGQGKQVVALRVNRPGHRAMENALIGAGLIIVDRSAKTDGDAQQHILTYKRKIKHPLCHPFGALTLSGEADKVLTLTEGVGCKVRDSNGKEYIDAGGGLWNTHIGLGNPEVIAAIAKQLTRLSYASLFGERGHEPAVELANELIAVAPYPMQWVCHTGSGSESTDLGIRLAVLYHVLAGQSERKKIIHLDASYHGSFAASASVSALMPLKDLFQSNVCTGAIPTPDVSKCPDGQSHVDFALSCANALEEQAKHGDVAAFIIEPMLGSAGVIIPPVQYFERIRSICDKYDILLIVDEVATGFGRTGRWFACEHYGLAPDILLLAKGINSGYLPLGAVLFSAAIGERFMASGLPLVHGSTYNGHPVCCASALANLEILKRDKLIERSAEMGRYFKQALQPLTELVCVSEVRGIGLMLAVGIVQTDGGPADPLQLQAVMKRLQAAGVLAYQSISSITFCPALIISKAEIDSVVAALHSVLGAARLTAEQLSWVDASDMLAAIQA